MEEKETPCLLSKIRLALEKQNKLWLEEYEKKQKSRRIKLWVLGLTAVPAFVGIGIYAALITVGVIPIIVLVSFVLSLYWLWLLMNG